MARVHEVIQRDIPAGPNQAYPTKASALAAEPDRAVVDARFGSEASARSAAKRINNGLSERWDNTQYYAIFGVNPEPGTERDKDGRIADAYEVLVLPRTRPVPEAWEKFVAPSKRRKRRDSDQEGAADSGEDLEFDDEDEEDDEADAEQREDVPAAV